MRRRRGAWRDNFRALGLSAEFDSVLGPGASFAKSGSPKVRVSKIAVGFDECLASGRLGIFSFQLYLSIFSFDCVSKKKFRVCHLAVEAPSEAN